MIQTGIYEHYKGNLYVVKSEGQHTETEESLVEYCPISHPEKKWFRPKRMFLENVKVGEREVPRFRLIMGIDFVERDYTDLIEPGKAEIPTQKHSIKERIKTWLRR